MEDLEHHVLCTSLLVPKMYLRYVDDIFVVWNEEDGDYREFLAQLNMQHKDIELTEELEVNGSLPFLDIRISRPIISPWIQECVPLEVTIYRKPSHADRYLHFDLAHPGTLKKNVVWGLWLCAMHLLQDFPAQLKVELWYSKCTLSNQNNAYPLDQLNRWFAEFAEDIRWNLDKLLVKTRLKSEEFFNLLGRQVYLWPSAAMWFPLSVNSDDDRCENLGSDVGYWSDNQWHKGQPRTEALFPKCIRE